MPLRYAQKVIEQADLLEETYTTEPFRAKQGIMNIIFL